MNKLVIDWNPAYLYVLFSSTVLQVMHTGASHNINVSKFDSLWTGFS
jgi:hypothetical protein